ncbi:glycosyltransferase family 4 protein [Methanobacterium oryzae]|uniref:glycosyltransferase family 4 protein n=1 Tax=Methanobacterium oryzae TaxID=69540 RepID=UPI003D19A91C
MNILVLHNTFLPDYTGSSIRLYNLLSRVPYNMSVLTPEKKVNGEYFKLKEEKIKNIRVKRASALSPDSIWKWHVLRYYYHEKKIFNSSKKEHFDIIQSRSLPPYIVSAYKLHKKFNKPFLVEVHPNESDVNSFYMFYIFKILKVLESASHVITLTNSLKKWIHDQYGITEEKISVINNGVDSEKFKPQTPHLIEPMREKLGNPEKIVMYAGYLDSINGINMLTELMPSIVEDNPQISFIFMGHGPFYDRIHKLSMDYNQIKLIPTVNHDLMPYYYQLSDVFIIPRPSTISSELVTPLKLLEAMSTGSVVLGSDVGGIKEVIKNEKNGYLFEKGNSNSFKDCLITALKSDNSKIAKNARKTILNEYNWDKSAQKLKNAYDIIL